MSQKTMRKGKQSVLTLRYPSRNGKNRESANLVLGHSVARYPRLEINAALV